MPKFKNLVPLAAALDAFDAGDIEESKRLFEEHEAKIKSVVEVGGLQVRQQAQQLNEQRFGQVELPESEQRVETGEFSLETLKRERDQAIAEKEALRLELESQDVAKSPEQFKARQTVATGQQTIAQAGAGTATAETTTRLQPTAERAQRSQLETNIKLDRVKGETADALINNNIPQIQAETQAAVLVLEPARVQSLIDLNIAKSQLATSDAKGIESLRPLAIANDWSNEEFDKWAFLQGKIELVEDDIQRRQDLYKALAQVKLNTGDKLTQLIAQSQGTGNPLDLLPSNVQKEEAERILTEQIIAQDDLIVRIFPEWAEIANKALLASQQAFGVEPSARDIKREKPKTPGATRTTPAQARRKAEGTTATGKLTQEQIRQKAAEFNQSQGR